MGICVVAQLSFIVYTVTLEISFHKNFYFGVYMYPNALIS